MIIVVASGIDPARAITIRKALEIAVWYWRDVFKVFPWSKFDVLTHLVLGPSSVDPPPLVYCTVHDA
jgi:hypothetical protein